MGKIREGGPMKQKEAISNNLEVIVIASLVIG